MDAALGWLGNIMEFLGSLLPRWVVVQLTHGGVEFRRGRNVQIVRPGLHWYWPVWSELTIIPVVRQTLDLAQQALTTRDEVTVSVGIVIVYSIADVEKALTSQWDLEDTVSDIAQLAVADYVRQLDFRALMEDEDTSLIDIVHSRLAPLGVNVIDGGINTLARTKVITMVGSIPAAYEDEE